MIKEEVVLEFLLKKHLPSRTCRHHKSQQVNGTLLAQGFWPKGKQLISRWHSSSIEHEKREWRDHF